MFPEVLKKANSKDTEGVNSGSDFDSLSSLANQYKDPYLKAFSSNLLNYSFQDILANFPPQREPFNSKSANSATIDKLIQLRERLNNLSFSELVTFKEQIDEERQSNLALVELEEKNINFNDLSLEQHSFSEVISKLFKVRLLQCLDTASHMHLLKKISDQLKENAIAIEKVSKELDEVDLHQDKHDCGEWNEDRIFRKISQTFNFQYFKYTLQSDRRSLEITFSIADSLIFSLLFEKRIDEGIEVFILKSGNCKSCHLINPENVKSSNPLNSSYTLANIYSRIIGTTVGDQSSADALRFLVYMGYLHKRIEIIRRGMNLSLAKHKISDIMVDQGNLVLHFVLFPKISKSNFSLKISVGLLMSEQCNVDVKILSSQFKKRNVKTEVFADLEKEIEKLLDSSSCSGDNWLVELIDGIVDKVAKDCI
jgi:hypothetical protein